MGGRGGRMEGGVVDGALGGIKMGWGWLLGMFWGDMGGMGELSAPEIRGDMVSRRSVGMLSQLCCFVTLFARWNR